MVLGEIDSGALCSVLLWVPQVSELTSQITEKQGQLDETRILIDREKKEQKKLQSEITTMHDMNQDLEE